MKTRKRKAAADAAWLQVLPPSLLQLALSRLPLPTDAAAAFTTAGLKNVHDVLACKPRALTEGALAGCAVALRDVLQQAMLPFLMQVDGAEAKDWPALRFRLLEPLSDDERTWFDQAVGLDAAPVHLPVLARGAGITLAELDDRLDRLRAKLTEHTAPLLGRLRSEAATDLAAFDGVLLVEHIKKGTVLHAIAHTAEQREVGLRLLGFLFPRELHFHRGALFGLPPRRYRRLLRALPGLVPPHRLPLPVDTIQRELAAAGHGVPRGVLVHVLRTELRIAIELDEARGEVAAADPRGKAARLAELLQEAGRPMALPDLVFAWRERFRRASTATLLGHLRRGSEFVQSGPETWGLRQWFERELAAAAPLVDKLARRLCAAGGRHHVATLLEEDKVDERTVYFVLDRLQQDPRVRLLGRGDACPATHNQSQVLDNLLRALRKAAGEVVMSRFLSNQNADQRRLIERLLRHNRLFVQCGDDRVDTLTNYPFNQERLQRLIRIVGDQLRQRTGYAHAAALKTAVDRADLGGDWLTPQLLADVLRRNGPFEVLPGDIVARADLGLAQRVLRTVRRALRDAGVPLTVDDVLQAKPELGEFAPCLATLLQNDPLVQSAGDELFMLE